MAKLTGQFTTPSFDSNNNKTHKPLLHAVVFVFDGATKVTRETDVQGKYSFDLAAGEYEVSVYLKGSTEKDRFDMRAGEKFVVTTSTPTDALEKWLQVIGDNGKDEVATYYENLLAQMQKVSNDFKDEAKADGTGLFVKQSAVKRNSLMDKGLYYGATTDVPLLKSGDFGFAWSSRFLANNPGLDLSKLIPASTFVFFSVQNVFNEGGLTITITGYNLSILIQASKRNNEQDWIGLARFYATNNTIVDSNGNLKAASPVLRLFNDRIETNDQFTEEPMFEKIGAGTYKISNTFGLAQEGWTYEKPRGSDGQPYFRIKVEKLDDGCIISVHDEYIDYEDVEIIDEGGKTRTVKEKVTVLSAPRDIKDHERWIDLRFHEEEQELEDEELLPQLDNLDESAH